MNARGLKKHFLKSSIFSAAIVIILLFSVIFIWLGARNSSQADPPMIAGVSFKGQYKIGDGDWLTYTEGVHIPADKGDVTLQGIFIMHNPETGEALRPVSSGSTVYMYFNHIGGEFILPSGGKIIFDAENDTLGEDACAIMWGSAPSMGETPVTIILRNPHSYGNVNAIDEFFENMSIAPGIYHESMMLELGQTERTLGSIILNKSF